MWKIGDTLLDINLLFGFNPRPMDSIVITNELIVKSFILNF